MITDHPQIEGIIASLASDPAGFSDWHFDELLIPDKRMLASSVRLEWAYRACFEVLSLVGFRPLRVDLLVSIHLLNIHSGCASKAYVPCQDKRCLADELERQDHYEPPLVVFQLEHSDLLGDALRRRAAGVQLESVQLDASTVLGVGGAMHGMNIECYYFFDARIDDDDEDSHTYWFSARNFDVVLHR